MKIFDQLRIALRTIKCKWTIFLIIGIIVGTFCLSYAGATWTTVRHEQSLPYELVISSSESKALSSGVIAEISRIPDVKTVSASLEIPVTIKTGKYETGLSLIGIDAAYLQESFSIGVVFQESNVMPYIVLNEEACKQFDNLNIDWLNAAFSLKMGSESAIPDKSSESAISDKSSESAISEKSNESAISDKSSESAISEKSNESAISGKGSESTIPATGSESTISATGSESTIPAKVCGILAEGGNSTAQAAKAYISLAVAKELLRKSGQSANTKLAYVRIINSGKAASVSKSVADLGMTVTNFNEELQRKWDGLQKEIGYLAALGMFSLICSSVLLAAWRKIFSYEQKEALNMLCWLGMSPKAINGIYTMHALFISIFGSAIGFIISLSLPLFLPLDITENSVFSLPIPMRVVVIVLAICTTTISLPMLKRTPRQ